MKVHTLLKVIEKTFGTYIIFHIEEIAAITTQNSKDYFWHI